MSREQLIISAAFDQASDAMIIADAAERVIRVNRKFTELTGFEPDDIVGQTPAILRSGKNDPKLFSGVWSAVSSAGQWRGEIWDRKKSGRLFVAELTISAIFNHHNKVAYYLGVYRDVTAAKEEEIRRSQQETREPHTFLLNRAAFCDQLARLCGGPAETPGKGALMLLDLDQFATVNDRHGVAAGDAVLYEAARRLRKSLRDGDLIGRLDGDEFGVIVPAPAGLEDVRKVTDKLLTRLSAPYEIDNNTQLSVGCSIGLIALPSQVCAIDAVLRPAYRALREVKRQGGNRWQLAEWENAPLEVSDC